MAKRGRPTKYTKEFLEKEAKALLEFFAKKENIFLKDFAIERKYPSQYLSEFAEKNEEFSEALNRAKDIQESRLIKKGLTAEFNPYFTGLTLKNVAGWRDKTEWSGDKKKPVSVKVYLPQIKETKNDQPEERVSSEATKGATGGIS